MEHSEESEGKMKPLLGRARDGTWTGVTLRFSRASSLTVRSAVRSTMLGKGLVSEVSMDPVLLRSITSDFR